MSSRRLILTVGLALTVGLSPLLVSLGTPPETDKIEVLKGKVVPLADLVEKIGSKLDSDAAPHWLALVTEDAKVYPLIKDDGSRLFFKDADLLKRPVQLGGHLLPGSQLLQVVTVHSIVKGQLHEVYYWCDICNIRRGEKMTCECCGGPMVRHEDPVKK
jgi:hypothetical protein